MGHGSRRLCRILPCQGHLAQITAVGCGFPQALVQQAMVSHSHPQPQAQLGSRRTRKEKDCFVQLLLPRRFPGKGGLESHKPKKKVLHTTSVCPAFCFSIVSCLGLPEYLCGVTAVRDLASMSLDHCVKRCFFLLFPKNRTELKLLLPLDACSLNPVHCASESACNFLLLSGLQEAEHTADRGF